MSKKVLHSFEELGTAFVPFPELPEVDLSDFAGLEAQAKEIREGAGRIKFWVEAAVLQLDQTDGMSREARELVAKRIEATETSLAEVLHDEVPAYRRAAWLAFLNHEFSRELHSREEVKTLLERLVREGRLIERADGELKVYDKTYVVSPDAAFGEPEVEETRKALSGLLNRVYVETSKTWKDKSQEFRSRATIGAQELANGTAGICALDVPPEKVQNGDQVFWRGGGTLLVQSDDQRIVPLDAVGSIEGAVREAKDLRVHLLVSSLKYETAPMVKLPPEAARKVQLLWHLIKRAIRAETQREQVLKARAELEAKATISPQEFFLEHLSGVCLVEFSGVWEIPGGDTISNLFLLVEREVEKESRIAIVEVPDHFKDFFASCIGEKFSEEGSKFEGVGQPLRAVLQAVYGQTAQGAAKTARINGNK